MSKLSQCKAREKSQGIPKRDESQPRVASSGQQRIYSLQKLQGNSTFYQYGHIYHFQNKVDIINLEKRFVRTINKYEILRSNYQLEDNQVIAKVKDEFNFKVERGEKFDHSFFLRPFKLEEDLLIRTKLFNDDILALSIHHIIADRQSLIILNKEIFGDQDEDKLSLNYFDFAAWSNEQKVNDADLIFWKDKLSGELPILSLPHRLPRKSIPSYDGCTHVLDLNFELSSIIKRAANDLGVTLYILILSAFNILLSKYSNQSDILVGTPVSNRDNKELEGMIGFFNETMVLRNDVDADLPFSKLLGLVKENFLNGLSHKNVSFSKLVQELNPRRFPGINPLFQAMFLYNKHEGNLFYDGQCVKEEVADLGTSKFDLTLFAIEYRDGITLKLEYSKELFNHQTAEDLNVSLSEILQQISDNPNVQVGKIITGHNTKFNKSSLNRTTIAQTSILDLVDFKSDNIAACFGDQEITYKELNEKSNHLAKKLTQEGAKANDFIGLHTRRSIEMIIGIVAILKSGAAYLPLDPSYPKARISFMIKDAGCKLVVSSSLLKVQGVKNIDIEKENIKESDFPTAVSDPDNFVYIIYTSGSSGDPKGVPITHTNLLNSTIARFDYYPENPEVFLLLSSFSFDSSVAGIFWTLCSGGKLVLPAERDEQDINLLSEIILRERVTHSLMLPSLYNILLTYADPLSLASLRNIMVAGEACNASLIEKHFNVLPYCKLYNEYGPTEATVWCIAHEFQKDNLKVSIGKPVPNYQAYVLSDDLCHVPEGVTGELYIGGKALATKYWNNEELTNSKFIVHPDQGRLYKTGDLAMFDHSGNLFFCGRMDTQVKIRGHRVELDEIRINILKDSRISEAVVILKDGVLIAYLDSDVSIDLDLPDYMKPSTFVFLPEFPRLPNGKIDLKNLPKPENNRFKTINNSDLSHLERELLNIWQQLLKRDDISVDDNFFDIGGDSLLSIQFAAIARKKEINLFASALFEHQSIRELAAHIDQFEETPSLEVVVALRKGGSQRPLFCIHGGGAHVFFYKKFANCLSKDIPVYSFQPQSLDGQSNLSIDIEEMSKLYISEMKKVQPHGPYQLLGTCFSNAVAIEMAHQLEQNGEQVNKLFIIDSAPVHLFGNNAVNESQTIRRFLDMLKRKDFSRIKSKIKRRIFGQKEWISPIKDATADDQTLKMTVNSLNNMYADYTWKPFSGRINFIRSSEFNERKDKKYHLVQWHKLALGGLNVSVVAGHHLTLFEDSEVKGLAKQVEYLLSEK